MQKWIDIRTGTEGGMEDLVFKEIRWKFHTDRFRIYAQDSVVINN